MRHSFYPLLEGVPYNRILHGRKNFADLLLCAMMLFVNTVLPIRCGY